MLLFPESSLLHEVATFHAFTSLTRTQSSSLCTAVSPGNVMRMGGQVHSQANSLFPAAYSSDNGLQIWPLEQLHITTSFDASGVSGNMVQGPSEFVSWRLLFWCAVLRTLAWVLLWYLSTGFWRFSYEKHIPLFQGLGLPTYLDHLQFSIAERHAWQRTHRSWMENRCHSNWDSDRRVSHIFRPQIPNPRYWFWITEETPNQATKSWRSILVTLPFIS